jgi:hypothetical protein
MPDPEGRIELHPDYEPEPDFFDADDGAPDDAPPDPVAEDAVEDSVNA